MDTRGGILNLPSLPGSMPSTHTDAASPRQLVQQFHKRLLQTAQDLLKLLSAAPVSFPVIRLIQQAMLPQAKQVHVAEVFLSRLFEEISRDETTNDPDYVEYDFLPGVRQILQETVPIPDKFKVIEAVSESLGSRYGRLRDFYALATAPFIASEDTLPINQESRPFARIVASVWRHIGGTYAEWADTLEQYISPPVPVPQPVYGKSTIGDSVLTPPDSSSLGT